MTDNVLKTWNSDRSDQPKFYAVGYRRPHLPFVAPKKYYDMYRVDEAWLAGNPQPDESAPLMAWFNSDGYVGSARRVGLTMPARPTREQAVDWNGYELRSYNGVPNHGPIDRSLQVELIRAYAACVSYVDAQIGKLLNELDRQQRLDKTHIILCADHGWHLGEHSAWGKMTNYEIATRVPLIIAGPGIPTARTQSLSELVDLYPTICDLAAIDPPDHIQGQSLTGTLRDPPKVNQSHAVSQYSRFNDQYMGYALRTSRYRFVRWVQSKDGQVVARELYDHDTDPQETKNLSAGTDFAGVVNELESQLDSALKSLR
jgi:arylsulfatase A-like enzyme